MPKTEFDYKRYLASREWALLKNAVRSRSLGNCERCLNGKYEQTHHLTYERIGHEAKDDLVGLCRPCHEYLSGLTDKDPNNIYQYTPEKIDGRWLHHIRCLSNGDTIVAFCDGAECLLCIQFSRTLAGME